MKKVVLLAMLFVLMTFGSVAFAEEQWQDIGKQSNVSIDKEWTIKFNQSVVSSKIEGVVIEKDTEFMPISVNFSNTSEIKVKAINGFYPNSNYTMRVFLANGKKYKMDFMTGAGFRDLDIANNDTYLTGAEIKVNEKVNGSLENEKVDYYKIKVPENGILDVKAVELTGKQMDLYVYSEIGSDNNEIARTYSTSTSKINLPLGKGTYYIRVQNVGSAAGAYTLESTFTKHDVADDVATSTYVTAPTLQLNKKYTGHIGHFVKSNSGNFKDYYKIELKEFGQLNVDVTNLYGKKLDVYLYGAEGNDRQEITRTYSQSKSLLSKGLAPGTYYIRIDADSSSSGSAYEIKTSFTQMPTANDKSTSVYVTAPELKLNQESVGLLGYKHDNLGTNTEDYYKINVSKAGTLNVTASRLTDATFSVFIYGGQGNDRSELKRTYSGQSANLTVDVTPGTYYIRLSNESGYGDYKVKATLQ